MTGDRDCWLTRKGQRHRPRENAPTGPIPVKATAAEPFGLGRCSITVLEPALELLGHFEVDEATEWVIGSQVCGAICTGHKARILIEDVIASDRKP